MYVILLYTETYKDINNLLIWYEFHCKIYLLLDGKINLLHVCIHIYIYYLLSFIYTYMYEVASRLQSKINYIGEFAQILM